MKKINIVGAGFSGLSLAYFLVEQGVEVEIFEQNPDVGGLIHTLPHPMGLVETAANGLLWSPTVQAMADKIGLKLITTEEVSKRRFIFYRGIARRWPFNFAQTLSLIAKIISNLFRPEWRKPRDFESVEAYLERVLTREALEQLLAPALQGIYAGDPKKMSARLLFGRFFNRAPNDIHGLDYKVQKFKRKGTVAPENGMGELISALKSYLQNKGVNFHFLQPAENLTGTTVWATSAWSAASGLRQSSPELAAQLSKIEILGLNTVTLFFNKAEATIKGFGVLFKRGEGIRSLGVLFNRYIFNNRTEEHSETWILGGAGDSELLKLSDEALLETIIKDRESLYKRSAQLLSYQITRWPKALPHYTIELEQILLDLKVPNGLFLHGNYLGRIGLSQILERSKLLAEKIGSLP